jgi:uncharacterized protein CbrC (UPF0167 family)
MPFWRRRAKPRRPGEDAGPPARERGRDEALPDFRYFPDPLAAGVFVESDSSCDFCGAARGYVYVGPFYALEEYVACPWCIADGSAAARSEGEFTDVIDVPPDVPPEVVDELAHRTPGFMAWQQERWLFHCRDAMAFLGPAGRAEIDPHPEAVAALEDEVPGEHFAAYLDALDPTGSPTAYLFRCLHCGTHLAYSDSD